MIAGSVPRTVFGEILAGRWAGVEVSRDGRALGTLHGLWRSDDDFSALLLLHAHDAWAEVARRRDAMAFALEIEQHGNGVRPVRVMTDKAAFPLLALDQAIRRLVRDNACSLEDAIGFSGRWLHANGVAESFDMSSTV